MRLGRFHAEAAWLSKCVRLLLSVNADCGRRASYRQYAMTAPLRPGATTGEVQSAAAARRQREALTATRAACTAFAIPSAADVTSRQHQRTISSAVSCTALDCPVATFPQHFNGS